MRGLYAIVDTETLSARGVDPVAYAAAVLAAKPTALQLRAKDAPAREVLALLRALQPLCHHAGVPLVANDRADFAVLAGCPLLHLGQEDIGIDLARRIAPSVGIGLSTHTPEQLTVALAARPTYVAYGPVFPTRSKADASPTVGVRGLREAHARARAAGIPLVAIGGITLERAREVAPHCESAAMIGGLVPSDPRDARAVSARAIAMQAALTGDGAIAGTAP